MIKLEWTGVCECKKGRAAIHWASRNGCLKVIEWLIEEKNIDKDCEMADGTTPFMRAAWMGHLELCEYLVKVAKCDIHRENRVSMPTPYTGLHKAAM